MTDAGGVAESSVSAIGIYDYGSANLRPLRGRLRGAPVPGVCDAPAILFDPFRIVRGSRRWSLKSLREDYGKTGVFASLRSVADLTPKRSVAKFLKPSFNAGEPGCTR